MLKSIPPILGPELLCALRAMGHGDDLVIADANFPGTAMGKRLIRLDGIAATQVLDAVLALMPLDDFVDDAATTMQVVGDADANVPIFDEFSSIVGRHEPAIGLTSLERFAFYERARSAYAVIQTGEDRLYGNIIVKKGVIKPSETS